MNEKIKKITSTVLIVIILLLAIVIFAGTIQKAMGVQQPMFLGFGINYMSSDNMGDGLPRGSLVLLHKQKSYNVNDIISYSFALDENESVLVTNRITEVGSNEYKVKGDGTDFVYPYVSYDDVHGKVILSLPFWIIVVTIIALWGVWIYRYLKTKKSEEAKNETDEQPEKSDIKIPMEKPAAINIKPREKSEPQKAVARPPKRVHIDMSHAYRSPNTNVEKSDKSTTPKDEWQFIAKKNK